MKNINSLAILLLLTPVIGHALFMPSGAGFDNAFMGKAEVEQKYSVVSNIMDHVNNNYSEVIKFQIEDSERINAFATYTDDDYPQVVISKGLVEHPLADSDVLTLMICHELGHFYGGTPKQFRGRSTKKSWSTAEGQADFYSTSICMKKLLSTQSIVKSNQVDLDINLNKEIDHICHSEQCRRIGLASYNVAKIYADIKFWKRKLSLVKKDSTITHETIRKHPNPQCRLDTLVAGLLCQEVRDLSKSEDLFLSCTNEMHKQPSCWLSPTLYQDI